MESRVFQTLRTMGTSGGEIQWVILSLCVCRGEGSSPRAQNIPEVSTKS